MTPKILLVEDDIEFSEYLKGLLTTNGFLVETAFRGTEALSFLKKVPPELVILDLTLPDMTGEAVCQEIRKEHENLPIIILSAKSTTSEKVTGLHLGADDYITKPFEPSEFLARINARLRSHSHQQVVSLHIADLELDTQKIEVKRAGKVIALTPQEYKLLEYLMRNPGVVLSREMILNRIWAYSLEIESRVVDVYIGYLRNKIDKGFAKKLIHSVRGFGYTIKE